MESKRFLLDFVFSNMKLNGKKLELPLKQPFLAVQEMSKTNNWCGLESPHPHHLDPNDFETV